jgi:hypothetical protein
MTKQASHWRFSMKRLFLIVLVAAATLGVWRWLNGPIDVRPAMASDPIYERYFGIYSEHATVRNIAVAEGMFSRSTWLSASFHVAEGGRLTQLSSHTLGRSPNRLGELPWKRMKITLAIGERKSPQGTISELGTAGQSRGGGSGGGEFVHHVTAIHSKVFAGPISSSNECVVYAEGDRPIILDTQMTVDEFLVKNVGSYLVVTAKVK